MSGHGPENKSTSPVAFVFGFIIIAAAAFAIGYLVGKPASLQDTPDSTDELAKAEVDSQLLPVKTSPAKGSNTAPVTLTVFGDFQCPGSHGASSAILDNAIRSYGAEQVRVVWKHLPLSIHADAQFAAQAAWAAAQQGKFWEYHDLIFAKFPAGKKDKKEMQKEMGAFLKEDKLVAYASELSLDVEKFKKDMKSPEAIAAVKKDLDLASSLGLRSTPTVYVNGRKVSFKEGVRFDPVDALIQTELAAAEKFMETPNAYYACVVQNNSILADGIKVETGLMMADAAAKGEGARGGAAGNRIGKGKPNPAKAGKGKAKKPGRPKTPGLKPRPLGPDLAELPRKGNPNAKITILEFSEFQCPFCTKVNPTIDQLLKAYPNDIQVAFVNFPLGFHDKADLAAQAAMAAHEQGKFWEYHDILFANQKKLDRTDLESYAEKLNLDMNKFRSALDSGKYTKLIDQWGADARTFGVTGTPSFIINGRKFVGAQPLANFKKVIDEEIKRYDALAAKGLKGDKLYAELIKTAPKEKPKSKQPPANEGRLMVGIDNAPFIGDKDAPVVIVNFTDFHCPFSKRGTGTVQELIEKNPGKVKMVFKHFPLGMHKQAPLAHRAAQAALNQGKFWEYHDTIFEDPKATKSREGLVAIAQKLGLDMAKFEADLDNADLDKQMKADMAEGQKVSVRGTPHFFINGTRFSGAQPIASFQAALDRELKVVDEYTKKGVSKDKLYETIIKDNKKAKPAPVKVDIKGSPFKGPENAPVTIIEFSEFECPFCSRVIPTLKQIQEAYPNDVKIVFKSQPLPMHKNAHLASQASLAAHAQGKFWEYHDLLFANQKKLSRTDLEGYAEQLGLNMDTFKKALDEGTYKAAVDKDAADAKAAGISGTPSFLINGKKFVGAQPFDAFKAEIDAALAETKKKK